MRALAVIFTIIFTICGKATSDIILFCSKIKKRKNNAKLLRLEKFYNDNPVEIRRLLFELETIKQKLSGALSANNILNQQLKKTSRKHSCFCERFRILILQLTHNFGPKDLETFLGYSYNTISNWLTNFKRYGLLALIPKGQLPWPLKNHTPPEITHLVWQLHTENPAWGRWRIAHTLWKLLIFISPSTVRNILKRPRPKKRPFWKPKKPLDLGPHLKKVTAKKKDSIWSIDLHTVMIGPYQSYIIGILDHYSRKILHMATHLGEPSSEWIINNIRSIITKYSCPTSIITDHGSQFISNKFKGFIYNFDIDHRKGKVGSPFSNGKIERFFGTMKRDILNLTPILTETRINFLLKDYIVYYNQYRPHQSLFGNNPDYCYRQNRVFSIRPSSQEKKLLGKVKRIKFCEGMLNAYVLN